MIIGLTIFLIALIVLGFFLDHDSLASGFLITFGFIFLVFVMVFTFASYMNNAESIGIIDSQDKVIKVYQSNIDDLNKRLNDLHISNSSLLNADSPAASLIEALSKAQEKLAQEQANKAKAYVDIAQRRAGPFWFVIRE